MSKHRVVSVAVVLLGVLVAGCGGGGRRAYDIREYWAPPRVGDSWTYRHLPGGETKTVTVEETDVLFGGPPMPTSYTTNAYVGRVNGGCPSIEYWSIQPEGLRCEGYDERACPVADFGIYFPAHLFPQPLRAGDRLQIPAYRYNFDGTPAEDETSTMHFVGVTVVRVPAGEFTDCFHARGHEPWELPDVWEDWYLARGVGKVLEIEDTGTPGEERWELISASIGGVTYP